MNRVELVGRLTKEFDFRYTRQGWPYARFTIVVDGQSRWDADQKLAIAPSNFISCVLWGPWAEHYAELGIETGERLYVLGELDQSEIETADGEKESKTRVRVYLLHRMSVAPGPPSESPSPDF